MKQMYSFETTVQRLAQQSYPNPLQASSDVANADQNISVLSYEDSLQEAAGIAEKIQFLHKHQGLAYRDIAVFYKKHSIAERICSVLPTCRDSHSNCTHH